jgi:hypothetical protein
MAIVPLVLSLTLVGQTAENKASLEDLQKRADGTQLSLSIADGTAVRGTNIRLIEKPVFRYSDELRQIEDAGIWMWTDRNRPVAVMKVERYRVGRLPTPWLYCFASLSSEQVRAEWPDAAPFQARKPGVTWKPLADQLAGSRVARLVQLRELAGKFSAEILTTPEGREQRQMRLLTRPLYRCDESSDVLDGAVFGFTGTGTNPDLLLLFDLPVDGGWRFAAATLTAEGIRLRLKDAVVYEAPHTDGKGTVFDTWCFFRPGK